MDYWDIKANHHKESQIMLKSSTNEKAQVRLQNDPIEDFVLY